MHAETPEKALPSRLIPDWDVVRRWDTLTLRAAIALAMGFRGSDSNLDWLNRHDRARYEAFCMNLRIAAHAMGVSLSTAEATPLPPFEIRDHVVVKLAVFVEWAIVANKLVGQLPEDFVKLRTPRASELTPPADSLHPPSRTSDRISQAATKRRENTSLQTFLALVIQHYKYIPPGLSGSRRDPRTVEICQQIAAESGSIGLSVTAQTLEEHLQEAEEMLRQRGTFDNMLRALQEEQPAGNSSEWRRR
jgi:hypothetical protein